MVPSCIENPLERFRMRVLVVMALILFSLGIPALGLHLVVFPDKGEEFKIFMAFCILIWSSEILFFKKLPYIVSTIAGFFLLYVEGMVSLYFSGTEFFGPIIIFLCPLLAAIMLKFTYAIGMMILNSVILGLFIFLHTYFLSLTGRSFEDLVVYAINFTVMNILCVLCTEMIMSGLRKSFIGEEKALNALELESLSLLKMNMKLEDVIEEKERVQEELRMNVEKFTTMIEKSYEAILILNAEGIIEYASQSVERIFGANPSDLIGMLSLTYVHREDRGRIMEKMQRALDLNQEAITLSYRNSHSSGRWMYVESTGTNMLNNPLINGFIFNIRDVTEYIEAEKKAEYYEFYDPLTRLPNRDFFLSRLNSEIAKSEKRNHIFAVLCVGIDRMKELNDIYGPSVCDTVIKRIGSRFKETYREEDLVSRFSRDEFMVLLSNISNYDSAREIIQKTFRIFSDSFPVGSEDMTITTSIGVCLYPNDGKTSEALVKNSESVMHMAKDNGRNTYHLFDASLHKDLVCRMELEKDIQKGIENDEFEIYYQPKVDSQGAPFGMEALLRWRSPSRGLVPPSEFIPVAEKNGLIIDLGYLVLRKSCSQLYLWREQGYDFLQLSVNISPYQFKDPDLVLLIEEIVRESGLDPEWIELEITESGIMDNESFCLKRLAELKAMGFMISIDDFGTGYSSLSKLKHYPVNTLKIDKSFVDDLPWDRMSVNIVNTIITLAYNLGFNVIAEGVENREQVDYLVNSKCEHFQGYYFSKPLPPEKFIEYLRSNEDEGIA